MDHEVKVPDFMHTDFVWGNTAGEAVYKHVLDLLMKYAL